MALLHIQLFQQLAVSVGDDSPIDLGSPTARALLAYLVLNNGKAIDRRQLAFTIWTRASEQAARRNLRQYLHRLRRSLKAIDPNGRLIQTTSNTVRFNPPDGCVIDVTAFQQAITAADYPRAISLYCGELLTEIYDDWVEDDRNRLARLYRDALTRQIETHEAAAQYEQAIPIARAYLAAEPLQEAAHVRLMKLHYADGHRSRVHKQYTQLCAVFDEELGIEPLVETAALHQQMMAGTWKSSIAETEPVEVEAGAMGAATSTSSVFAPAPPPPITPAPDFVGRTDELDWLRQAYVDAQNGRGNFCIVRGESGVGKSRLIAELLGRGGRPSRGGSRTAPTGTYLFHGRGHEFEAMIPYSLMAQAIQMAAPDIDWAQFDPPPTWLNGLAPLLPQLADYVPAAGAMGTSGGESHHIIEAVSNLLLTLSQQQPVVLYLDNLHWADMPTWNLLGYLAQRIGSSRLLILGAVRVEDMPGDRRRLSRKLIHEQMLDTLTLERLNQGETAELARHLSPDQQLDPLFLCRLYEETEGNPFFIVETIRAVLDDGKSENWTRNVPTDREGKRPFFAIPLKVQAVIESRLDKLDDESRATLAAASAIGHKFTFDLLQAISRYDTETILAALDEWLARGLVRERQDGYIFSHDKIEQVAYEQLSRARRQWTHLQIADYLTDTQPDADPAQLAHHYYLSSQPARALPYLARAGERALRVRSYAEAREFGLQAIGLMGRFPASAQHDRAERIDLNLQLAQAYAFTGAQTKALQLLHETERVAESLDDGERLAHIFYRSSQLFWLQGEPQTADDYARRTLRRAEELDHHPLRFAALRMLGRCSITLSSYDDAIAYLLRYIELGKRENLADLPAIYGYLGVAYARVGSWKRALDAAQTGVADAGDIANGAMGVVARMQLAFVYGELYEWENALKTAVPVQDVWREEGMTPHTMMLRAVVGRAMAYAGRADDGIAEIQAALDWADDVGYKVLIHVVRCYLAEAYYQQGEYGKGVEVAKTAVSQSQTAGNRWAEGVALRVQSVCEMRQSQPDWLRIESRLLQAMRTLRDVRARPDLARTYLTLRRLYDRAGQTAWAVDCHFRAITIFEELGMTAERKAAQGQSKGSGAGGGVILGLDLMGPTGG